MFELLLSGRLALLGAASFAFLAAACGPSQTTSPVEPVSDWRPEGPTTALTFPDGSEIEVELRLTPAEQQRGMQFRPALPPDKGMLFVFSEMQPRPFWMYRTPHPLDIVWLDDNKRIVEIVPNAAPCLSRDFRECPTYGGSVSSVYVVELRAGSAARRNLRVGDQLRF